MPTEKKPAQKKLPEPMVLKVIQVTLAEHGRDAVYDDYKKVAERLYPDAMKAYLSAFSRQGFIKWLKAGMRRIDNIEEAEDDDDSDEERPEPLQLSLLPGMPPPAYVNIGSNSNPRLIEFLDSTEEDFDILINKRELTIGRVTKKREDFVTKREWLRTYRKSKDESIGAVLKRVQGGSGDKPPTPDAPHPEVRP